MKKYFFLPVIIIFIGCLIIRIEAMENKSMIVVNSYKSLKSLFKDPPVEFRSAPLWVWNDEVTESQIDQQLLDLKAGGIGGVFIHPRPGLITPYLSDKWFSLCRYTVDKGKELGMNVWLYDENSYPSGFAGGHVPAEMPESYNQGQGLIMHQVDVLPEDAAQKYYIVLKSENSKFIDITSQLQKEKDSKGDYYLFEKVYEERSPWFGGYSYVDLLLDGVTEKFIEVTMTGYQNSIGDEFGKAVPGIFTDEPNIHAPDGIRWTPALFSEFQKRWGYDLKTNLPSLFIETGDWMRIRHNYYTLLLELFIEKWSKPWYQYCEDHDLVWTGHYWEHGWPDPCHGGDNMAMYAWHQMPAIDILMNQYSENVNAQFGNVRAVKELSSVANQMGRTRTLSETYGAGGWDLRFEDMKRIDDWQSVLGVNFLNQHLSYITIKGARKRDHPQSFSYHEPWWKHYKIMGDYSARLSLALSSGKQNNRILVFEPTGTAWMYFSPVQPNKIYGSVGPSFQNFVLGLEKYQIEYDLGSENIIKNNGKIQEDKFVVGRQSYDMVVFPPGMENIDNKTAELVEHYLKNGGKILSFNNIPEFIEGARSEKVKSLANNYSGQWIFAKSLENDKALAMLTSDKIQFEDPEKISGILFHHRRELQDGNLVFLVNTSLDDWANGKFETVGKAAVELNLVNGDIVSYPSIRKSKNIEVTFDLPPAGSLLLYINNDVSSTVDIIKQSPDIVIVEPASDLRIERIKPNMLTLDYCDLVLDDVVEENIYFFRAADKIFRHHGFDGNPWSRAVQYKTTILDRGTFQEDTGFEARYSFIMDDEANKSSLCAVVERPELWELFINGKIVKPDPNKSWLDRAFGVFNIGQYAKSGKNIITLNSSPMTVHSELEPVYILGNFSLKVAEKGWQVVPISSLSLGSWAKQGLPFYSDGISYTRNYDLSKGQKRYILKLTDWQGSVAEVRINNKSAGIIAWTPNELDVTEFLKNGKNNVSVIVYGTLKNLLGPHHNGPIRGAAWPSSFEFGPDKLPNGRDYDFIDYGLFSDFMLIEHEGAPQRVYYRDYQVSTPVIGADKIIGIDSPINISLTTSTDGAEIHYTLNGDKPEKSSDLYSGPITLKQSAVLKTCAYKDGLMNSHMAQQTFYVLDSKINGLNYAYYEGKWHMIPDFKTMEAVKEGRIYGFNLNIPDRRPAQFGVEFNGFIQIEQGGDYTFYLNSNDGSILTIGDIEVVNNDGDHGNQEKQGKIKLKQGLHPIKVLYFDAGGSQSLDVMYQGPGIEKQIIPADKLMYRDL